MKGLLNPYSAASLLRASFRRIPHRIRLSFCTPSPPTTPPPTLINPPPFFVRLTFCNTRQKCKHVCPCAGHGHDYTSSRKSTHVLSRKHGILSVFFVTQQASMLCSHGRMLCSHPMAEQTRLRVRQKSTLRHAPHVDVPGAVARGDDWERGMCFVDRRYCCDTHAHSDVIWMSRHDPSQNMNG